MIHKGFGKCSQTDRRIRSFFGVTLRLLCVNCRRGSRSAALDGNMHALFVSFHHECRHPGKTLFDAIFETNGLCGVCFRRISLVQIITRKELNKRMISSAGTRKLYMMQLGDNT